MEEKERHISGEQKAVLKKFVCERFSAKTENKTLAGTFECQRGRMLVEYLQKNGWEEDLAGETAFYLVKDPLGVPRLFFSLKCGALFQPLQENILQEDVEELNQIIQLLSEGQKDHTKLTEIKCSLQHYRMVKQDILLRLQMDREREKDRPIYRVMNTYAGIEMVHFCSDDGAKAMWKTYSFPTHFGETMFWWFIAPIIMDIQKQVGCRYAFIFAADRTVDGTLTNYYTDRLQFSKIPGIGTAKPQYDLCCDLMSQEISLMREHRDQFFAHFNPDPDEV